MNTGMPLIGRPSLGSWVAYGLGSENDSLPAYVVMLDKRGGPISGMPNWSSGFMPATYQGTLFRPSGSPILDLSGPGQFRGQAQRNQLEFLDKLNRRHLLVREKTGELAARIQNYELAYRMQAEAPEAVDLSAESGQTLEAYGVGKSPTDEFGKNCLIGANSLITEDKVIPDNSLVMGSPGKVIRNLDAKSIAMLKRNVTSYVNRASRYKKELKKLN